MSNWLTEPGKPDYAVCIPDSAVLAVQLPDQGVRGAFFEQRQLPDNAGNYDFLNFLDGKEEKIALNDLPLGTGVRALSLYSVRRTRPALPDQISSTNHSTPALVPAAR